MNRTVAILAMVLVSAIAPVSAFAGTADQQAYAGSHVAFDAQSNALVDYSVDGERTVDSVRVQSQSDAESDVGLGGSVDLEAVADMTGAALSLETTTDASASLRTDSGAAIEAHDNGHGSLVVTAADGSQYVALNVSGDADVERVSDERVVFTTGNGTTATAMVAGDGSVAATGDGNLTASLEEGSRLAVRAYTEGRADADAAQERLIVDGTAAAGVYVMERGGQTVTDTVTYSNDTTVDVSERAESRVDLTVSRTAHEGRVVIAHVANETFESAGDVQVSVDGEAAARASSYVELREAAAGGENSKFLVQGSNSAGAQAETDVVVGINHFSTRQVTMTDSVGDGGDQSGGSGGESDGDATDGDATDDDSSDGGSSDGDSSDGDSSDGATSDGTETDGDVSDSDAADDSSSTDSADDDATDGNSSDGDSNDAQSGDGSDDASSGDGPGFGVLVGLLALAAATGLVEKRRN